MKQCPAIEMRNVKFAYPDGTVAIKGVDLVVPAGQRVALLGPNGAGKSTLLYLLNGLLQGEGEIRILGLELCKKNLKEIRRRVGLVFQNPDDQLFSSTVYDDVAFGPRNLSLPEDEVERRVKESLRGVGLNGVESRSAFHLSFGQKRRVAIATVLSMDCEILALDEPTSNLDSRGRRELLHLLTKFQHTQLIATQDFDFARSLCERAIVINRGRIVADGDVDAILADRNLLLKNDLA